MRILLLGMNHRSAPLELRERLATQDPNGPLRKLTAGSEIDEAVLTSTCNRVEVVVVTRSLDAARLRLRSFFARDLAISNVPFGDYKVFDKPYNKYNASIHDYFFFFT